MMVKVGQELLNVPFGEMILKMGIAIAEAQAELDRNAVEIAKFLAEEKIKLPKIINPEETVEFSLISLGFYPPFYHFQESIIEVKMAITMARVHEAKVSASFKAGWGPFATSVNASYSSKYNYKVEGSSLLRTKLVPVEPPAALQKYIEALIDKQSKAVADEIASAEESEG